MRIGFIGSLPPSTVLPEEVIRPRYRKRSHAAPWIAALLPALAEQCPFRLRMVLVHRAIQRHTLVERDAVEYEGIPCPFLERWHRPSGYWTKVWATRCAMNRFRPHLIHAFGLETGAATVALRCAFPVSCFIQGILARLAPYLTQVPSRALKTGLAHEASAARRIRWFVAETGFARDWALHNNPSACVSLIPHSLRREFLEQAPPTLRPRLVSVGALDDQKGMDTVIRAFSRLPDPDARLCIIGDGSRKGQLMALRDSLPGADRVEFTGPLDTQHVIAAMQDARALVIASRMDTSPNVVTEAHAIGLPVVGTRAGGIPEMIDDGVDGFVVDVDDHVAMADRMALLLADPDLARRMGAAGREKVRVLNDPARIARAHVEFFTRIGEELNHRMHRTQGISDRVG